MKKKLLAAVIVIIAVAAVVILLNRPQETEIRAKAVSVGALQVTEDVTEYLLCVDASDFGGSNSMYFKITDKTYIYSDSIKNIPPEAIVAGDILVITIDSKELGNNVAFAKKIRYVYNRAD